MATHNQNKILHSLRAKEALENNYFADEIVPVCIDDTAIKVDEIPRPNTTGPSKLKPAFLFLFNQKQYIVLLGHRNSR